MKIKSRRDFWSGLMFLVTGAAFGIGSRHYALGSSAHPGPGFFPLLLSVLLTLIGAVIVFKALTLESEGGDPIGPIAWKPLGIIVVAIVVFGATIDFLGMLIAIPLLVGLASLAGDGFHWRDVLINAAVLTLVSWLIFDVGLKLTIPLWPRFVG